MRKKWLNNLRISEIKILSDLYCKDTKEEEINLWSYWFVRCGYNSIYNIVKSVRGYTIVLNYWNEYQNIIKNQALLSHNGTLISAQQDSDLYWKSINMFSNNFYTHDTLGIWLSISNDRLLSSIFSQKGIHKPSTLSASYFRSWFFWTALNRRRIMSGW